MFTSSSTFTKIVVFSLLSFTIFSVVKRVPVFPTTKTHDQNLSFFNSTSTGTRSAPPPPPPPVAILERTGIINEFGVMTDDFEIGEFDEALIESVVVNLNSTDERGREESSERKVVKVEKFRICDDSVVDYVPRLENADSISRVNSSEKYQTLDCLVPRPKGYKLHIPWPKSRDEVWFNNVPHTHLLGDKGGNGVSRKNDKIIFSGEGTTQYLDQISKMVPDITFGGHIRVALDIGSVIANFGAYLMEKNVTVLSMASKYFHQKLIQLPLERGLPAMMVTFGSRRLPFPSQAFDLIHCSQCAVNWTLNDGMSVFEANRLLRAGGYFVLETQLSALMKEMEDLTSNLCWKLVTKDGHIAIWQKPLNNSCYLNRNPDVKPLLCDVNDNADDIWNANVKACITRLPENGYGANITNWPGRLHSPPDRLFSIQMDAFTSRKELYKADSKYQNDLVKGYIGAFRLNEKNIRNVMDMRAGYGGFAAAFLDFQVNSWVMNVVPTSGANTLPVIYDRGLVGVMHDWCEPFDTPPRSYDLLNAAGLFSVEQRRCNITNIMLEMDRILRPGGHVYIRDTTAVILDLREIASAIGWVTFLFDSGEGPHSNWKLVTCEKRL